jgi:hypothetical protein
MANQAHGSVLSDYSYTTPRSVYKIKTLLDISNTGIVSDFREEVPLPFVDDLKNIINNQETWNQSRNRQRNWETFVQAISLRAQPIMLTAPVVETITSDWYDGEQKVWTFEFGVEIKDVYADKNDPVSLLNEVLNQVPIITGLTETATITPSMIDTLTNINTKCSLVEA